jgi:hypothetical protein
MTDAGVFEYVTLFDDSSHITNLVTRSLVQLTSKTIILRFDSFANPFLPYSVTLSNVCLYNYSSSTHSFTPFNYLSWQVSISGDFQHLPLPGYFSSLALLHPHSRFAVVWPSSFALLRFISMPLVVIGDLPFHKLAYTISAVFRLSILSCFFLFNLQSLL